MTACPGLACVLTLPVVPSHKPLPPFFPRLVKFQRVNVLTIFIESNQGDADSTVVQKLAVYGSSGECRREGLGWACGRPASVHLGPHLYRCTESQCVPPPPPTWLCSQATALTWQRSRTSARKRSEHRNSISFFLGGTLPCVWPAPTPVATGTARRSRQQMQLLR